MTMFFISVVNHPKLLSIFENGNIQYVETQPTYQPPAKETKPKEAKEPKAEAAPKAAKAPKAPKAKEPEDDDEDDNLVPAEPKAKNPLDDLPKSAFNLEEWKRQYSNLDTRKEALPWFYEKWVFSKAGRAQVHVKQVRQRGLLMLEGGLQVQRGVDVGVHVQQPGELPVAQWKGAADKLPHRLEDSSTASRRLGNTSSARWECSARPMTRSSPVPLSAAETTSKPSWMSPQIVSASDQRGKRILISCTQGSRTPTRRSTCPARRTRSSSRPPWRGTWSLTARSGPTARTSSSRSA